MADEIAQVVDLEYKGMNRTAVHWTMWKWKSIPFPCRRMGMWVHFVSMARRYTIQ